MRCWTLLLCCSLSVIHSGLCGADTPSETAVQIGQLNEAYVTAFNGRDAEKIGALFDEAGEFTLLTGDTLRGRGSITAAHASFFKGNPEAKISGEQISLRLLRPDVAIATGKWEVKQGPREYSPAGVWSTVVTHAEGNWRYAAMRLMVPEEPTQ